MRLDRHDRLLKAFNKLRTFHIKFWDQEVSNYHNYRLDNNATAPHYLLGCYNYDKVIRSRSVGAYVHWLVLQILLKINYEDADKGAFVGNTSGFPEITFIGPSKIMCRSSTR